MFVWVCDCVIYGMLFDRCTIEFPTRVDISRHQNHVYNPYISDFGTRLKLETPIRECLRLRLNKGYPCKLTYCKCILTRKACILVNIFFVKLLLYRNINDYFEPVISCTNVLSR